VWQLQKRPASESGPYNAALILLDLRGGRSGAALLQPSCHTDSL